MEIFGKEEKNSNYRQNFRTIKKNSDFIQKIPFKKKFQIKRKTFEK